MNNEEFPLISPPSGLPPPALQALCKLITASEAGEQLINRVRNRMLHIEISLWAPVSKTFAIICCQEQLRQSLPFSVNVFHAFVPRGSGSKRISGILYHCVTELRQAWLHVYAQATQAAA